MTERPCAFFIYLITVYTARIYQLDVAQSDIGNHFLLHAVPSISIIDIQDSIHNKNHKRQK